MSNKKSYLIIHIFNSVLVGHDVSLNELMLLHQVLDGSQVLAVVIRVEKGLDLSKPEVEILDGGDEGPLTVGFFQLQGLLGGLVGQYLPLLGAGLQTVDNGLLRSGAFFAFDLK